MDPVTAVRRFSRFYTNLIGALRDGLLDSPYSLTEARVIFELAQGGSDEVADLRRNLDIDAGYLSRILRRLETDGLAERSRSAADGRRQLIQLTAQGRKVFDDLDARSSGQVRALLDRIDPASQDRLVDALTTVERILGGSAGRPSVVGGSAGRPSVVLRAFEPGDLGWVVQRHGALYASQYGWDQSFEVLVARIVADYAESRDPRRENAWIAELDGSPVGCVFCVRAEDDTAQLRLLLVEPHARGAGVGTRLVDECVRFARQAGYREVMLWTNDVLVEARRIYQRAGFELVSENAHHSFGRDLVGQYWKRGV
jgi:DNA-binding MarR family transcriptional regulator/GNAT superfamily N-acetyltransferase